MHNNNRNKIIIYPSYQQIKAAIDWLQKYRHSNPDLEYALNLVIQGKINPQETGELVAISYKPSITHRVTPDNIQGVMMINSGNTQVSFDCNRIATQSLFSLVQKCGFPNKIITSMQVKHWIRPLLLEHLQLEREYNQLVMVCTKSLSDSKDNSKARWASMQDESALKAYEKAYIAERGNGNLNRDWRNLIQKRQIAVLEYSGEIVSAIRYTPVSNYALVIAPFTFPKFRRQGFARKLLAFLTQELLQEYTALKLWVDEDNIAAIALYNSVNFQQVGCCYTGYFCK